MGVQIDIKADNNPDRLFRLMKTIVESYPDYESNLSPRLILGLWHPIFLTSALEHVPTLRRVHIGGSPTAARTYFWKHCDGFSMWFPSLIGTEGQSFIQQARNEGKDVFVWTVNRQDEMIEATRWGVKAILTDKTDLFQDVRKMMLSEWASRAGRMEAISCSPLDATYSRLCVDSKRAGRLLLPLGNMALLHGPAIFHPGAVDFRAGATGGRLFQAGLE